jgi:hypothetical protein
LREFYRRSLERLACRAKSVGSTGSPALFHEQRAQRAPTDALTLITQGLDRGGDLRIAELAIHNSKSSRILSMGPWTH